MLLMHGFVTLFMHVTKMLKPPTLHPYKLSVHGIDAKDNFFKSNQKKLHQHFQ